MAEEGKLDPVVGQEEIERVCQILSRRKKKQYLLEPGVGISYC
jgi:ATP-dependent Clp protease ATP-binding subunit ClpA